MTALEPDSARTTRLIQRDLDANSAVPLYHQVADALIKAVTSGELPSGSRLGSEVEIGEQLRLSRPTIRRAIGVLVDRGLVVRRRGIGSMIMGTSVTRSAALTGLFEDLSAMGRTFTTTVLDVAEVAASPLVAEHLGVDEGAPVTYIHRLRHVDGAPFVLMENYLPGAVPIITEERLATQSLYRLMDQGGLRPAVASQAVSAGLASGFEAGLLGEQRPCPVLITQRTSYDDSGMPVEFARHVFVARLYSYEMNLVRGAN
jgi:GntR family transcriptional regulator